MLTRHGTALINSDQLLSSQVTNGNDKDDDKDEKDEERKTKKKAN